jgi:hypothetical protein
MAGTSGANAAVVAAADADADADELFVAVVPSDQFSDVRLRPAAEPPAVDWMDERHWLHQPLWEPYGMAGRPAAKRSLLTVLCCAVLCCAVLCVEQFSDWTSSWTLSPLLRRPFC